MVHLSCQFVQHIIKCITTNISGFLSIVITILPREENKNTHEYCTAAEQIAEFPTRKMCVSGELFEHKNTTNICRSRAKC